MNDLKTFEQLKMNGATAYTKLRKALLFNMAKKLKSSVCYRCNKEITDIKDFSIDHKIEWLDSKNPVELFFDIENIAFSHMNCNRLARRPNKTGYVNLECSFCGKTFLRKSKVYKYSTKNGIKNVFCSVGCSNKFRYKK